MFIKKKDSAYICGLSSAKSPNYYAIVKALQAQIDKGAITTKAAAKDFLASQL